jgi:hypothetical protein
LALRLTPNPFGARLTVGNPGSEAVEIRIADLRGAVVARLVVAAGSSHEIESAHWPAGLYAVEARTPEGWVRRIKAVKF